MSLKHVIGMKTEMKSWWKQINICYINEMSFFTNKCSTNIKYSMKYYIKMIYIFIYIYNGIVKIIVYLWSKAKFKVEMLRIKGLQMYKQLFLYKYGTLKKKKII